MKPQALICDIDGVVCDSSIRLKKYIDTKAVSEGDYTGYKLYSQTTEGDVPIKSGIKLLRRYFYSFPRIHLIWVTSRQEQGRELTLKWLQTHVISEIKSSDLIMNGGKKNKKNKFSPPEYKRNILKKLQQDYEIVLAIEDNIKICEMYNSEGIPTIHLMIPEVDCLTPAGDKEDLYNIDNPKVVESIINRMSKLTKEEWIARMNWIPTDFEKEKS